MFKREGSQRLIASLVVGGAFTLALSFPASVSFASGASDRAGSVVELPREILPWRQGVEEQADRALKRAHQALQSGNRLFAERQFKALIRRYPRTFAAAEAERDLTKLNEKRVARAQPRGLGGPTTIVPSAALPAMPVPPVAGWQTRVVPTGPDMREALIEAAGDRVFFKEGSARLNKQARIVLRNQARWLKSNAGVVVRIAGPADDQGSTGKNMRLAHDRAIAVQRRLIGYGVPARRLRVFSFGNTKPIAICAVRRCAVHNRRVVTEIRSVQRADAAYQ